jgi:hypothetical protein
MQQRRLELLGHARPAPAGALLQRLQLQLQLPRRAWPLRPAAAAGRFSLNIAALGLNAVAMLALYYFGRLRWPHALGGARAGRCLWLVRPPGGAVPAPGASAAPSRPAPLAGSIGGPRETLKVLKFYSGACMLLVVQVRRRGQCALCGAAPPALLLRTKRARRVPPSRLPVAAALRAATAQCLPLLPHLGRGAAHQRRAGALRAAHRRVRPGWVELQLAGWLRSGGSTCRLAAPWPAAPLLLAPRGHARGLRRRHRLAPSTSALRPLGPRSLGAPDRQPGGDVCGHVPHGGGAAQLAVHPRHDGRQDGPAQGAQGQVAASHGRPVRAQRAASGSGSGAGAGLDL